MTSAARTGVTTYATPNDREIVIARVVDAPRRIVFDAFSKPEHVSQWLLGPPGWTMPICEIDLPPGGKWRYVYRRASGSELTLSGSYLEVDPPERLVLTESWGPEWPETVNTTVLAESGGQTTITITVTYPSKEARDATLATGAADGMGQGFARLDALLESLA